MNSVLAFILSLLSGGIRLSTPIAFGALGGTISERCGIVNMGIEGMMLMGAFSAAYGSYLTGNAYVGLLAAVFCGVLCGLALAVLTIRFKCEHVLAGLGVNMFSTGITVVLLQTIWGSKGKSSPVAGLAMLKLPIIEKIPLLQDVLGSVSPLLILLIIAMIATNFLLYKTTFGLRARVIGESPYVAGAMGVDVYRTQYICVIIGAVLATLGGAYLSIGDVNLFSKDMAAGRGFIALAIVILGGWRPYGAVLGALIFGMAQSLQIRLQAAEVPPQLVQMLPYVITIVSLLVMRLFHQKLQAPASDGEQYYPEGH